MPKNKGLFIILSPNTARKNNASYGVSPQALQLVWDTIALHTSPGIAEYKEPEVALLNYGAALDVIGKGYDQLPDSIREEIVRQFPRNDLKKKMIATFFDGFKHKPHTTYGSINADICACMMPNYQRKDYCDLILHSPWAE